MSPKMHVKLDLVSGPSPRIIRVKFVSGTRPSKIASRVWFPRLELINDVILKLCSSPGLEDVVWMAESAAQLFARLGAKQSLGDLGLPMFSHLQFGLQPSDVIEFCGAEGSGKTEMLVNIVARCVLPKSWNGSQLPGRGVEVVYICTDYKFDLLRLVTVLEGKVHVRAGKAVIPSHDEAGPNTAGILYDDSYKELIKSCLSRVHVVYCNSSAELLSALHALRAFLQNHPEVCALCLDHIASFYWADRSECGGTRQSAEFRQQQWVNALSELVREHHLVVFAARPLLLMAARDRGGGASSYRSSSDRGVATHEDTMCRVWQRLVKYRFHLQKPPVPESARPHPVPSGHKTLSAASTGEEAPGVLGTFTSQQSQPPGPLRRFVVQQHGLEFIP